MKKAFLILPLLLAWLPNGSRAVEIPDFELPAILAGQISGNVPTASKYFDEAPAVASARGLLNLNLKLGNFNIGNAIGLIAEDKVNGIKSTLEWDSGDNPISESPLSYAYTYHSDFAEQHLSGAVVSVNLGYNGEMVYRIEDNEVDLKLADDSNMHQSLPVGGIYGWVALGPQKSEEVRVKFYRRAGVEQLIGEGIDLKCENGVIHGVIDTSRYSRKTFMAIIPLLMRASM